MKTLTKALVAVLAVAMAAVLAVPASVGAQEPDDQEHGDATVAGKGWLYAKGVGEVDIHMGGAMLVRVNGDVQIKDLGGDLRVHIRHAVDDREALDTTTTIELTNFRGLLALKGSNFEISIQGKVKLKAHGRGVANLVGHGIYRTRRGHIHLWEGPVEIAPAVSDVAA